ncbi:GTP binding protein [Phlyctema vagabunda]|uniref:GTP binding protein n=1 Tax=Phlyctema vagabunda TaxID=108571 RepID=A0ABR4PWP1_9HELO
MSTDNNYMNDSRSPSLPAPTPAEDAQKLNAILGSETFDITNVSNSALTEDQQHHMMASISDVFDLEEEPPREDEEMVGNEADEEEVVDVEDQQRRTERLKSILATLAQLWWSDSRYMDVVTEKLADGSRDPKWRIPLGNSGVLNFFLEILSAHSLRHNLKIHTMRLIGNSCADTDENRSRVVGSNYLPSIIQQLDDTTLLPFAIPVLYNIIIDYEPAQLQASNSNLSRSLIELVSSPRFNDTRAFLGYVCKLLGLLITQATEPDHAPDNTAIVLLQLAADREHIVDMDDFLALVNTAVAYLKYEKFQKAFFVYGSLDITLSILVDSYTRFDTNPSAGVSQPDQDDAKQLSQMRSGLNQTLSDISSLPEFAIAVPVISPFASSLRRWLSSPQIQLQVCACIMLGNIARSDAACEEFVHTCQVHKPLITVLNETSDSQLLHATLGFLKNLALPAKNKQALGEAGLMEALPRLWALDTLQQIQYSSISLARVLIVGTFDNVRRIVQRLSSDPDSPANMRSHVSLLIALFERTDVEPVRMEIARLLTAMMRVVNTYKGRTPEEMAKLRKKFFVMHPDVGRPLSFMVSQTKWPVVRSEGWFVFALMARYPEGAECISNIMHDVHVFQPLVEMLTGRSIVDGTPVPTPAPAPAPAPSTHLVTNASPESEVSNMIQGLSPEAVQPQAQSAEMARIDRENGLVLISELLKNWGSEMAVMRKEALEDLLKGGGELVLKSQQQQR